MQSQGNASLPYEIRIDCLNKRDQNLQGSKSALSIANIGSLCKCFERSELWALLHPLILPQVVIVLHLGFRFSLLRLATLISFHRLDNRRCRSISGVGPYGFNYPIFRYIILLFTIHALTEYIQRVYQHSISTLFLVGLMSLHYEPLGSFYKI